MSLKKSTIKNSSSKPPSIYDEYFGYDAKYKSLYGEKTCVLLEVGSFFEIYTYKTISTDTVQHPQTLDISLICNLCLVNKKANYKTDDQQIMMMGFRNIVLEKYVQKLVEMDFTVVVFTQEKNGNDVSRTLNAIYSRGTFISGGENTDDENITANYAVCVWLEIYEPYSSLKKKTGSISNKQITYGISAVNIFTGHSVIFEHDTVFFMTPTTFDEMERFFSTFTPSEMVVVSNTVDDKKIRNILGFAGVQCNTVHIHSLADTGVGCGSEHAFKIGNCEKQTYIQTILSTYFNNPDIYHQYDEFQRNPFATQSFCYLLDFIKEHNCDLIRKIAIPTFTNTSNRMVLANHTLKQLNIINDHTTTGIHSSVLAFMNRCGSSIGKRLFARKLLNPIFDSQELEKEYSNINSVLKLYNNEQIQFIRKNISQLKDVEKMYRQIIMKKITPSSIYQLFRTIEITQLLHEFFKETKGGDIVPLSVSFPIPPFIEFLTSRLHLDICKQTTSIQTFEQNIICPTICNRLDGLVVRKNQHTTQLNAIYEYFNTLIRTNSSSVGSKKEEDTEFVKIHETEKSGVSLQLTKKRAMTLKKILASLMEQNGTTTQITIPATETIQQPINIPIKDIHISHSTTSNDEIEFPFLSKLSRDMLKTQDELNNAISTAYLKIVEEIETEWSDHLTHYADYIGLIDVLITKTFLAREYNYCRPQTEGKAGGENDVPTSNKSFIKATNMRHCLIEHIQTNEIYVPNDITIGIDETDGILLFGTNAIGKTSLIRSIGICVILAQAGMYVPCETFVFKPYTAIFSRIIGNDNLFKNLSTFQVEIGELSVILKHADENSLILGDEICSSTELQSGLSIIMSALMDFHARRSSFIFATHFHEIVKWEEMEYLPNIKVKHLEVVFDPETGKLIYNRKLKEGVGVQSYGLTVCKSMNLPLEFLETAFKIRNRHYPENMGVLSLQPSKYNFKKLVGICEKCNVEFSSETHHVQPQRDADINGAIHGKNGTVFHKNHRANLLVLCNSCHKKEHGKG